MRCERFYYHSRDATRAVSFGFVCVSGFGRPTGGSVVDTVIRGSQVMHYQAAGVCVMSGFTVI